MSLDVYLQEDVARILRGLLFAHPEWGEPLTAVALSFGIQLFDAMPLVVVGVLSTVEKVA